MFKSISVMIVFFSSLFVLMFSAVLSMFAPNTVQWNLATIILATVSSSAFFPLMAGYFYDKFKEEQQGENVSRVFREFSEAGILRVYKDREESKDRDNAEADLKESFANHSQGRIKIVGVSLRVFFNQTGPFYQSIVRIAHLHSLDTEVGFQALVCEPSSHEVLNRAKIETPDRLDDKLIEIDIKSTIASIQNLNEKHGKAAIEYGYYCSAPYCTLIIFPEKCYFSPNILSTEAPVRLPMIQFAAKSHGYVKLEEYFDYLWQNRIKSAFPGKTSG
ncbi:MAG: hypothetical protein MUO97_10500 [Dehalococcoidia bacterium]|nr:hypothetical protein [Dehalococcoidia bacterium]